MDENLTAEVNSVTYHMTALIVTTAVKTSDLTIHFNIHAF
jgi:phosphoribosyl-ATP pyrophosphohydrolase